MTLLGSRLRAHPGPGTWHHGWQQHAVAKVLRDVKNCQPCGQSPGPACCGRAGRAPSRKARARAVLPASSLRCACAGSLRRAGGHRRLGAREGAPRAPPLPVPHEAAVLAQHVALLSRTIVSQSSSAFNRANSVRRNSGGPPQHTLQLGQVEAMLSVPSMRVPAAT